MPTDLLTIGVLLLLIGLYALANIGERSPTARTLTLIAGALIAGFALLIGAAVCTLNFVLYESGAKTLAGFRSALLFGVPVGLAGALGLLYLSPAVQRLLARIIPLRAGSPVVYLTVVLGLVLIGQQIGIPLQQETTPLTYTDLLSQDIPFFMLAFVGVGLFTRRSWPDTLERLGLVRPAASWWWIVALLAVALFLAVAYGIERVADVVAPAQQKQVTDVSNVLFSHFNNPAAVIFLGLLAGVVEETLFRGALVPRMGVIVSAILFAALHTQYAISFATLEVLVLGIGLGLLRVWSRSTLPCMVTHAGYDIAVGLIPFIFK
ncbi:MAG TPA: CPBP family intramembrane glutamic endopeptidase [Candidatus Dormibacteraeota bacterium]